MIVPGLVCLIREKWHSSGDDVPNLDQGSCQEAETIPSQSLKLLHISLLKIFPKIYRRIDRFKNQGFPYSSELFFIQLDK
jgi:hypothetical protein